MHDKADPTSIRQIYLPHRGKHIESTTHMPANFHFFRPILATDRSWIARDWLSDTPFSNDCSQLVRCFIEAKAAPLADLLPLVTPVTPALLENSAFIDEFDPKQVIFVLPEECLENSITMARCKELRSQGHRLGIRLESAKRLRQVPLAAFDHLQIDSSFAREQLNAADLGYADDAGFRKIATNVTSHETFSWVTANKFDWSESRFLSTPNPTSGKEPDLARLKLLKLLNLVKQDGDTREIEAIFREEPKLSFNLLRLVNSVAVGARTKISNFSQAIAILGRRQLQRWLQLLIYADNLADSNTPNPLMQLAAARGRQMELLSAVLKHTDSTPEISDNAFITGLFSLLDVLLNMPMNDILKELPVEDDVATALSPKHGGVLGHLLAAVIAGESGNYQAAEAVFSELMISPSTHARAQVQAYYWANRINTENSDQP